MSVAVMAFKAVWALEQKRRDNDRKILALHMEMKEMMGVLTQYEFRFYQRLYTNWSSGSKTSIVSPRCPCFYRDMGVPVSHGRACIFRLGLTDINIKPRT